MSHRMFSDRLIENCMVEIIRDRKGKILALIPVEKLKLNKKRKRERK